MKVTCVYYDIQVLYNHVVWNPLYSVSDTGLFETSDIFLTMHKLIIITIDKNEEVLFNSWYFFSYQEIIIYMYTKMYQEV